MSVSPPTPQIVYVESRTNNLAVVALICGIIGILGGLIPAFFIIAWGFGVTGIVLAIVAERKAKTLNGLHKTMARWAGVLAICAFILGCIGFGIVQSAVNDLGEIGDDLSAYSECIDQASTSEEMYACD